MTNSERRDDSELRALLVELRDMARAAKPKPELKIVVKAVRSGKRKFKLQGTKTGRIDCSKPNLSNLPRPKTR